MCLYSFAADNAHIGCRKMKYMLLFVSDITGSEMKQELTYLPHWCFVSCEHDRVLFTSKFRREIVAMCSSSPY